MLVQELVVYRLCYSNEATKIGRDNSRLKYGNIREDNSTNMLTSTLAIAHVDKVDFNREYCCVFTNLVGDRDSCILVKGKFYWP